MRIDDLRRLIDEYFEKEDFERSLEYSEILESEHSGSLTAEDIFKKGLCYYRLDDNNSAIACFDRALETDPDNILALTNKGICLYALHRIPEAFNIFNRVLKTNPDAFPAWYYIGLHYLSEYSRSADTRDLEILVNAYRRIVGMSPHFAAFPIYDPVKKIDYSMDMFLMLHSDIRQLSIDELTAIR